MFDHYAVRLVILANRIISRHPVTPTGDSHSLATSNLPNIGEFTGSVQQIRGCQGVVCRWSRAVEAGAVTTTARIAIS